MESYTSSFATVLQRLRDVWGAQNRTARILIGLLGGALIVGLGIFASMRLRGPDYGVLFANLPADDASAVVTKLKDAKIPYQLTNGGTTILVPQENVYEERVVLAGDGIVKGGGTGYELFDKMNFGMTDFQEKIAKQRATEGELQRTIAGLTPVESARVHLASPEASLYSSTQAPTTASVAIKTRPGMQLGPTEVRGITQLVANSVEGLKPDHVTIVNQDGNVLVPSETNPSDPNLAAQAGALKLTGEQLVAKQRYESNLQENIQGLLDAAIGPHRSAVRVATDMNFDANENDSKTYAPQGTVLSQQTEKEAYTGTSPKGPGATGIPATTSNTVPTYQGTVAAGGTGNYKKSKATLNYDVTEQNIKHVDAPGKLTRESVAVLVNVPSGAAAPAGAPAAGAVQIAQYTLAAADIAKIRNVVAAAAGIDPNRGDQISVEAIPFAPLPEPVVQRVQTVLGLPVAAVIAVAAVLALGLAGFLAVRMRRRSSSDSRMAALPSFDSSLAEQLPSFEEHPMLEGAPGIAAPIRSAADLTREQMIEYVTTVATDNPDSIAKLVKLWLAE